ANYVDVDVEYVPLPVLVSCCGTPSTEIWGCQGGTELAAGAGAAPWAARLRIAIIIASEDMSSPAPPVTRVRSAVSRVGSSSWSEGREGRRAVGMGSSW